ncbi:hypothetical protein Ahy_B07g087210 isoform B [Arachis hypogaea]|nr:hypothetical protein Ahy_B07g087210 isoform B [Arachis hypogaea]
MWENSQEVAVIDIGLKKMLFSFKDKKRGLQIIQNGPWNVKGNMVNLRLWREGKSVFEVDHDFMEFWIQVHGIPHDLMEKETDTVIGEMLGVLAEAEDPKVDGILKRSYLRIRVSINITKALPTGFWLDRDEMPPLWVFFNYERLPDSYCFNCGILGHEKKMCKNPTTMACWDPSKKKYSPGLGVTQIKPGLIMRGGISRQHGWKEAAEEQACEHLGTGRDSSDEQSTEESRIRAEQVPQQKIKEESVRKNLTRREEEMPDAEEQVEEAPKIPKFQDDRDMQFDLGVAFKFKNFIKEIRERNMEWANKTKAQKRDKGKEAQELNGNGLRKNTGPNLDDNPAQVRDIEGCGLSKYPREDMEINSYKIKDWKLGQEDKREKKKL